MNNQKGFTLIELMIVIAIIAILAAIALPAYNNYVAKSQVTEAVSLAGGFKTKVGLFVTEEGSCPSNSIGSEGIDSKAGQFVKTVDLAGTAPTCTITVSMAENANAKVRTGVITMTAATIADTINTGENPTGLDSEDTATTKWSCVATNIPASMLPKSCKATASFSG